jgi:hypothetical protein
VKSYKVTGIVTVLIILSCSLPITAYDFNFLISSDYDDPLDEHIQWCLDFKSTTEARAKIMAIPVLTHLTGDGNGYLDRLADYFEPNDLVPHQRLQLNITAQENEDKDTAFTWNDIYNFIETNEEPVKSWLNDLTFGVSSIYGPSYEHPLRFRLYNEVNTFNTFTPRDYYRLLDWFYPIFKAHAPRSAILVISLSGSEAEGTDVDYRTFLRHMISTHLEYYSPDDPLPFDGMDLHGYHTSYQYWSGMYQNVNAVFQEMLGVQNGSLEFSRMKFWALETTGFPRGICETVWSQCIFEYNSDWDAARHWIRTITHVLNLPNMQFITLPSKIRPEWNKRYPDGMFQMAGMYDHGCHIFDKGTHTPSYAVEPLRKFSNYLWKYNPDTSLNHVLSTSNVRRYQFKTPNNKYRLIVWRDHGNRPLEMTVIPVPFEGLDFVWLMDFVSGNETVIPVGVSQLGRYVEITLTENPLMITPTKNFGELLNRIACPHIRSGVTDAIFFDEGNWQSTLYLFNPEYADQFIEVQACDKDGTQVGSPYENMIPAHGALHLNLESVFDPFEGFITVLSSGHVIGQVEHQLHSQNTSRGVVSAMASLPLPDPDMQEDTTKYLLSDWETSSTLMNLITLANLNDTESSASVTVFDETGLLIEESTQILAPNSHVAIQIAGNETDYRFGIVDIDTVPGIIGQITRYSTASDNSFWYESALLDDNQLITELELKDNVINDALAYSRVVVVNPWSVPVSGIIREFNSENQLLAESPVSMNAYDTLELVLNAPVISVIHFKLDNEVRVFARREDIITDSDCETVTSVSSRSVKPDYEQAGTLILPYFIHDTTPGNYRRTVTRIRNDNAFGTIATVTLYDTMGGFINCQTIAAAPESITTVQISDLIPEDMPMADGGITIAISQVGGVSAEADYQIQVTEQGDIMSMTAMFQQVY